MTYTIKVENIPAIEVKHNPQHKVYCFAYDPKKIRMQANIDRLEWDDKAKEFSGYQRGLNEKHVSELLAYLSSGKAVLPNVITLAINEEVQGNRIQFVTSDPETSRIRSGTLVLPFQFDTVEQNKGIQDKTDSLIWVIDGQHRLEAMSRMSYTSGTFPVIFSAIISSDNTFQGELFCRLNLGLDIDKKHFQRILSIVESQVAVKYGLEQLAVKVREKMLEDPNCPFKDLVVR